MKRSLAPSQIAQKKAKLLETQSDPATHVSDSNEPPNSASDPDFLADLAPVSISSISNTVTNSPPTSGLRSVKTFKKFKSPVIAQAVPAPDSSTNTSPEKLFCTVLFTKAGKKKNKVWKEGIVRCIGKKCTLKDIRGKQVAEDYVRTAFSAASVEQGFTFELGDAWEVEVDNTISEAEFEQFSACVQSDKRLTKDKAVATAPVSADNIGNKLMKRMGWTGGALGKTGQGVTEPIPIKIKVSRGGLGFRQPIVDRGGEDCW